MAWRDKHFPSSLFTHYIDLLKWFARSMLKAPGVFIWIVIKFTLLHVGRRTKEQEEEREIHFARGKETISINIKWNSLVPELIWWTIKGGPTLRRVLIPEANESQLG